jgi:hypothetical protein
LNLPPPLNRNLLPPKPPPMSLPHRKRQMRTPHLPRKPRNPDSLCHSERNAFCEAKNLAVVLAFVGSGFSPDHRCPRAASHRKRQILGKCCHSERSAFREAKNLAVASAVVFAFSGAPSFAPALLPQQVEKRREGWASLVLGCHPEPARRRWAQRGTCFAPSSGDVLGPSSGD